MAFTTKERTEMREELVGQGFSWEYIDDWQPKTTLYRHKAMVTPNGELISPVGTALKGLPGNPDYVLRKARSGLLPNLPGETCTCRWCGGAVEPPEGSAATGQQEVVSKCPDCDIVVTAATYQAAGARLRAHSKTHHSQGL